MRSATVLRWLAFAFVDLQRARSQVVVAVHGAKLGRRRRNGATEIHCYGLESYTQEQMIKGKHATEMCFIENADVIAPLL